MKLLSINGSMRPGGETDTIIQTFVNRLKELDPELDYRAIEMKDIEVEPCRVVCSDFCTASDFRCCLEDSVNSVLEIMEGADAVLLGAPLYFRVPPAKFHALMERIISIYFYKESRGVGMAHSPLFNKPCVLVGVAEYTNPSQVLEYLQETCHILKMRPVMLPRFPYLGVGGQGAVENDRIFEPLERAVEMAEALWNGYISPATHDGVVRAWQPVKF